MRAAPDHRRRHHPPGRTGRVSAGLSALLAFVLAASALPAQEEALAPAAPQAEEEAAAEPDLLPPGEEVAAPEAAVPEITPDAPAEADTQAAPLSLAPAESEPEEAAAAVPAAGEQVGAPGAGWPEPLRQRWGESPERGILLNFRDAPLNTVLEHLSEVAGLIIVQEATVEGRVTVMSRQPLSVQEAVLLLNTVLASDGYAAIKTGRTLKIVTLEAARQMNVPVRAGSDPNLIEPTDEIVTHIIPLKFADAEQVSQDLEPLIPEYATLSANASSNALILTDTSANVRRVVEIVNALDTHLATVAEVKVFQLQYADAADAAQLINEVFEVEADARSSRDAGRGPGRFWRGPGGSGGGDDEGDAVSRAPAVTAAADERTNTLVVSGPSDTLVVVTQVVEQLDSNPAEEESVLVYPLNNAQASVVAETLNNLFEDQDEDTNQGGGRGFFRGRQTQQTDTTQGIGGLAGEVLAVAEEDTNTVLVLTAPSNFERLRGIIEELDRPIPQVLIKVLVAEVTWNDDVDIGVEFSILNGFDEADGCELVTDFGLANATGGLIWRCMNGDVGIILRALEETGKLEILSRPQILASDNQTATILVGQEVPFITNTRVTDTGQTINSIEYRDIGISLEVTPHINPEGLVIMDVLPEVSATTPETVPISEVLEATVFATRSAETRIAILDGQTIVIGGLMADNKEETIRKVPLLGDLPVLGALFRRTEIEKDKTELLIFLTPHVAPQPGELLGMSREEMTGIELMPHAIGPGVFDEHMDGLRLMGGPESPRIWPGQKLPADDGQQETGSP